MAKSFLDAGFSTPAWAEASSRRNHLSLGRRGCQQKNLGLKLMNIFIYLKIQS